MVHSTDLNWSKKVVFLNFHAINTVLFDKIFRKYKWSWTLIFNIFWHQNSNFWTKINYFDKCKASIEVSVILTVILFLKEKCEKKTICQCTNDFLSNSQGKHYSPRAKLSGAAAADIDTLFRSCMKTIYLESSQKTRIVSFFGILSKN